MPHYQCHRTSPGPAGAPRGLAFSFQSGLGRCSSLTSVARRVTLNFQRTQRSPSGVLTAPLSPRPRLKGTGVTRHPLRRSRPPSRPPPLGPRYSDPLQLLLKLLLGSDLGESGHQMMGLSLRRLIRFKVRPDPTGSERFSEPPPTPHRVCVTDCRGTITL